MPFCEDTNLISKRIFVVAQRLMGLKRQMLTGRTAKYVEALIREGDDFDYFRWLHRVREEEARLKSASVSTSMQPIAPGPGHPTKIAQNPEKVRDSQTTDREKHKTALAIPRTVPCTRSVNKPKKSLRQRLADVCSVWDDFQENRSRDAVYGYLRAVFSIVKRYSGKRRTKRLMRRAYKFAGLPIDPTADPFAVVIRCTCEHKLDNKTISKWSRALRYVARVKKPRHPLTTFMKDAGGINACANLYAKHLGRGTR
jgi:hypothetical protein